MRKTSLNHTILILCIIAFFGILYLSFSNGEDVILNPSGRSEKWKNNIMMIDSWGERVSEAEDQYYYVLESSIKREEIFTVNFLSSLSGSKGKESWDISYARDGSVLAWVEQNQSGLYDLYIAGEGGVSAPYTCWGLFSRYKNMKYILFNDAFHTDKVTNMDSMFSFCENLERIDLSGFNTENVTDMRSMFAFCRSLQEINFTGFQTAQVENMNWVFYGCESLRSLDLSSFRTENVVSMNSMFQNCTNLQDLNVSSFSISDSVSKENLFEGTNLNESILPNNA